MKAPSDFLVERVSDLLPRKMEDTGETAWPGTDHYRVSEWHGMSVDTILEPAARFSTVEAADAWLRNQDVDPTLVEHK